KARECKPPECFGKQRNSLPMADVQSRIVPSSLPVASVLPSRENTTEATSAFSETNRQISFPDRTSITRHLWSAPTASSSPSGEKRAMGVPRRFCPQILWISFLLCRSHKMMSPFQPPAARIFPLGKKATQLGDG